MLYKYEYYENSQADENEFIVNYSNNTENGTNIRISNLIGIVEAIRFSWLDILLFIWIITLIIDEIEQVKI